MSEISYTSTWAEITVVLVPPLHGWYNCRQTVHVSHRTLSLWVVADGLLLPPFVSGYETEQEMFWLWWSAEAMKVSVDVMIICPSTQRERKKPELLKCSWNITVYFLICYIIKWKLHTKNQNTLESIKKMMIIMIL